ncbi:MAG: LytTR family DNA-binding domain-containing protein [Acidobacteriota bacterium]
MSDERTLRLVIVDDEPPARDLLRAYVEARDDLVLVGEGGSGDEACRTIESTSPDVVFLDVQMPEGDGFSVLEQLAERGIEPLVVFVTAYDRYAVRAFEVNAVDFLPKPVTRERFGEAITRCRERTWRSPTEVDRFLEDALHRPPQRLLIRERRRIVPVPVEAIDWLEADDDYVRIHVGGKQHLIEKTLKELERLLASRGFVRIHRGAVVNLSRIQELQPLGSSRYALLLKDGTRLTVSRSYSEIFRRGTL